jgi:hypothetical protein
MEEKIIAYTLEESRCESFGECRCGCGYCNVEG